MTSIHYAGAESSPALLISPCLFSTQRVRLLRGPIQTHSAHFDETVLPMMSTRHENTHTQTHLLNSPVGSSRKQLKYSLIMDSALEQSGTTLKKKLYIYIKK